MTMDEQEDLPKDMLEQVCIMDFRPQLVVLLMRSVHGDLVR